MSFRRAHLLCWFALASSPALACGAAGKWERVEAVEPGGDLVLEGGERARLGGLWLAREAQTALAARVGARLGVAELAAAPDRWGRRIVDLFDGDGSVARDLLLRGLALVRPEPETRGCVAERLEAEAGARAAGEGVWERGAVLAASDAAGLAEADGRFALVEGTVRRVGEGVTKVYLDFAGGNGFSVVAPRRAAPMFRRAGVDLAALVGKKVIVRGVLDLRFGPRIEIVDPSMIELSAKETGRGG